MAGYLLDTNALSEIDKPRPNAGFMQWFDKPGAEELHMSCITFGELYKGIELLAPATPKRDRLEKRANDILTAFDSRVLVITVDTAILWAKLMAQGTKTGRSAPSVDALIAAQAIEHNLTLVTRNTKDFEQFADLDLLCPWSSP